MRGASTFSQHAGENALHFLFVASGVVPVDGAFEAFAEENLWLPAEKFLGERVVSDAVERAGGHVFAELDLGFVSREFTNHFGAIDHPDAFHRSEVNRRAIIDFLPRQDGAFDNVVNLRPIADLRAVAPNFKWVLSQKRARNHGDDRVILNATRAIDREIAA